MQLWQILEFSLLSPFPSIFSTISNVNVGRVTKDMDFQLTELCKDDFNCDRDVDGSDLAVFAADFGRTDCPCDLD